MNEFFKVSEHESLEEQIRHMEEEGYTIVGKEDGFIIARRDKDSKEESKEAGR